MKDLRVSRRQALACVGGAAAALSLGAGLRPLLAAEEKRVFKIGVCDWSAGKGGDPDVLRVAAELGLDGAMVTFSGPGGKYDLRKPEARKAYEDASKKHGTVISSLGMGCLNEIPYKSDPRTEEWVSDAIDAAKAVGVKVILLAFFGKGDLKGDKAGTDEVVKRLKKIAPKAEKEGVILGFESWLNADEHLAILDAVGSPAVHVYYDVGNMTLRKYDILKEIRQLGAKRLCEFHAKDYSNKPFGQGQIDFPAVRKAMDDIGWRGWIQLEEDHRGNMMVAYKQDREYLKTIFPPDA
ncbi:MAG: sugar phosphate isomerase/epimerase [Planctomycetota bacterium]|nr:sugar phosphate isomerase/epimerase [Planctomycetota bacterium]